MGTRHESRDMLIGTRLLSCPSLTASRKPRFS